MKHFSIETRDGVGVVRLSRGKVNAIDGEVIAELGEALDACERDDGVRAVVLTGTGSFFSFGFDVPLLYPLSPEEFGDFIRRFTDLYRRMFVFPRPLVAALNGHAVAGGCMLATTADHRVMASGKARISLNEIGFGSAVFAGSAEMLRFLTGSAAASKILYSGALWSAEEAKCLGLVEDVAPEAEVMQQALTVAAELGSKAQPAFAAMKHLLRGPVAAEMKRLEPESLAAFVKIWYSEATREKLRNIAIR